MLDVGEGFLNGSSCGSGQLHIVLRVTKPLDDVKQVQYAAKPVSLWPGGMITCDITVCVMSKDRKQVDIYVDGLSGNALL